MIELIGKFVGIALVVLLILALADVVGIIDARWFWERNAASSLPKATLSDIDNLKASVSTLQRDVAGLKSDTAAARSESAKAAQEARSAAAAVQQTLAEAKAAANAANAAVERSDRILHRCCAPLLGRASEPTGTQSEPGSFVQITELGAGDIRKQSGTNYLAWRRNFLTMPTRDYGLQVRYIDARPGKTTFRVSVRQKDKASELSSCNEFIAEHTNGSFICAWDVFPTLEKGEYNFVVQMDGKVAAAVPIIVK